MLKPEQDFVYFTPRPLRNLGQVDKLDSIAPVLDMKVADIANEDAAQLFLVCLFCSDFIRLRLS